MTGQQLDLGVSGRLFFGDNLEVLRRHIGDQTVDLVYLDPPFNSKKTYNLLFRHQDGKRVAGQVKAFDDTWGWSIESETVFRELVDNGGDVAKALLAFRDLLGTNDMLAYLTMMTPRLVELHRVLKPTGSLFLHCDPTASHYLKVLLDNVFEPKNFRNEIAWHYSGWNKRLKAHFERRHDVVLFYARQGSKQKFHSYALPWDDVDQYLKVRKQKLYTDESGRDYVLSDAGGGRRVRRYIEEAMSYGRPVDDVWDIDKVNNSSSESVGYPTQKPRELLERIIEATTDPGDLVLDPFCGCGTTVDAAQRLGRNWVGIDITRIAIEVIQGRLAREYNSIDHTLHGEPATLDDAEALADLDKHEFQDWVCRRLGITARTKKGADRGIDGELVGMFENGDAWRAIVSVKGGGVNVAHVRDLRGTVEREHATMGILVSLRRPSKPMIREAAEAGLTPEKVARIQILTVEDLFAGRLPTTPLPSSRPKQATDSETSRRGLRRVS